MANVSKINGYDIKDSTARDSIDTLETNTNNTINEINSNIDDLHTSLFNDTNKNMFTFIFDSGFDFHATDVADIFLNRDLQCGFAIAPQEFKNNRTNDDYSKWLNPYIHLNKRYGFSLLPLSLRHGNISGTGEPDHRVQNEIWGAKDSFNILQINSNGWVSPYSHINDAYKKYLYIYGYAFNTYTSSIANHDNYHVKSDDIYNLTRISLSFETADIKALIDNTIENNGFVCFYGHNDISASKIAEIVDYIIDHNGNIYAPDQAVANYFGVTSTGVLSGNYIENLLNQAEVTTEGTNQNYKLYLQSGMTYDADTKTISISRASVTSSDDIYFYFNIPLSLFNQKDFSKHLYSKFRITNDNITSALYSVRIEHRYNYSPTQSCNMYEKMWREPQSYECYSYPPIDNYTGIVRVLVHILPEGNYSNVSISITDMLIGFLS